jgi:hypothetical protein
VRSIAWWEGFVTWASFAHRYDAAGKEGAREIMGPTWLPDRIPPYARLGEVEMIDGFVIGMSPWAVRELRFDETLGNLHGYDFDICLEARAAGKKVATADFRAVHHHSMDLIGDVEGWIEAHMKLAEKWDGRLAEDGIPAGDWKQRARRAEAEAAAARLIANGSELMRENTVRSMLGEIEMIKTSASWRLTAPLRWLLAPLRRLVPRRPPREPA